MKLSPNVRDISEIALACEEGGADGISLVNTFSAMSIDLKSRRPLLANITGGLSGPAIFPIALRMVYEVYKAVKIPLIGIGGISSAEDVLKMLFAGATAVQIGAYNLKNPYACKEIIEELPKAMEKYGIDNLSDIIGGAHIGA
jgi:dihydroorotate dehydrogenase (NAD+) catalytic subunit